MFGKIPLYFERNDGQAAKGIQYTARGSSVYLALTDREMIVTPRSGKSVRLRLDGSEGPRAVMPLERQIGVSNYMRGSDPAQWQMQVPHFARVQWRGVYPGVDVIFHGRQQVLEYDFVVAPKADPRRIRVLWEGASQARLTDGGDLVLGDVRLKRPRAYQRRGDGPDSEVAVAYRLTEGGFTFDIGKYDHHIPLIIDPVLSYSTYIGDFGADEGRAIGIDGSGNVYLTGWITKFTGVLDVDAFIGKLNPTGTTILWFNYLGGSASDRGFGLAVDNDGNSYVVGGTESANFPTLNPSQARGGGVDGFVSKFNPAGTMVYSTYLGGSGTDSTNAVAVDSDGNAYVTGLTGSTNFPTTSGAFRTLITGTADAYCTKLTPAGNALVYSTVLGGAGIDEGFGIALDGARNAYITGYTTISIFPVTTNAFQKLNGGSIDGFVTKINAAGSGLSYSTYLGGGGDDIPTSIAVDEAGHAYVTGKTGSQNFPTTDRAFARVLVGSNDAFVTKLNSDGSALIYSTFLGGGGSDSGNALKVSPSGHAFVVGTIGGAANFPTAGSPYSSTSQGGSDAFVTVFTPLGDSLTYSTFFGGNFGEDANGVAIDRSGNVYFGGTKTSTPLQVTAGVFDTTFNGSSDAFVAKMSGFDYSTCIAGLDRSSLSVTPGQSSFDVLVNAPGGCGWNSIASVPFLAVTAGASGLGGGFTSVAVNANLDTKPRTGSVSIAGNIIQLIQPPETLEAPYNDVPSLHPFANFITLMKANAITSGCTASQYCPDATTTRGQMAVFIIRAMLGNDLFPYPQTPYFSDVPASHPFFKWIQKMRELGITTGCGATTYCPDDAVTRGQMAVFILRALTGNTFSSASTAYFTDVPSSNPFFAFVQKMKEWGVTTGCSATDYCVNAPTTRGQMAVFIVRAFFTPR